MAALRPRPFTQGQLDSLCGIYCIINSLAWAFHSLRKGSRSNRRRVRPLNTYECRQLFGTLVTALILRQATGRSATEGMPWAGLAVHQPCRRPQPNASLNTFTA